MPYHKPSLNSEMSGIYFLWWRCHSIVWEKPAWICNILKLQLDC